MTKTKPKVVTQKKRVRTASAIGTPGNTTTWFSGLGSPSGIQFNAVGSGRMNKYAGSDIPKSHKIANTGAAPLRDHASISDLIIGDSTMPPTDRPDDAAAIADARFA